jgi:hypothetical protein
LRQAYDYWQDQPGNFVLYASLTSTRPSFQETPRTATNSVKEQVQGTDLQTRGPPATSTARILTRPRYLLHSISRSGKRTHGQSNCWNPVEFVKNYQKVGLLREATTLWYFRHFSLRRPSYEAAAREFRRTNTRLPEGRRLMQVTCY